VKAKVELALVQSLETASGKAEQIGFYFTVLGDAGGAFSRLDAYRRTTRSDLLRVARRYLDISRRSVIEVHPEASAG
jgi:zinc protease